MITAILVMFALLSWVMEGSEEPLLSLVLQIDFSEIANEFGIDSDGSLVIQDVWAEGDLAVVTARQLIHLVDLSDIESPQITTIELDSGYTSQDAKIVDGKLYLALQASLDGGSMLIYDVADPKSPRLLSTFASERFAGAHNIFIQGKVAFLATAASRGSPEIGLVPDEGLWLVDISNPRKPIEIGTAIVPETGEAIRRVHDVTVIGNRAYVAGWTNGFWILDFENLDDPQNLSYEVVAHHNYDPLPAIRNAEPRNHNLWPSEDGQILWSTDEVLDEGVRVFDISDLENIKLLGVFTLGRRTMPHNVVIDGVYAYVSYYFNGLQILQFDPEAGPIKVADFDTAGGKPPGTGAWGVYPFGDRVLVSDVRGVFSVFEKNFSESPDTSDNE